jgi:hypothetical protein
MRAPIRRATGTAINILAALVAVVLYFALIGVAIVVADDPRWLPPALVVLAVFVAARILVRRSQR